MVTFARGGSIWDHSQHNLSCGRAQTRERSVSKGVSERCQIDRHSAYVRQHNGPEGLRKFACWAAPGLAMHAGGSTPTEVHRLPEAERRLHSEGHRLTDVVVAGVSSVVDPLRGSECHQRHQVGEEQKAVHLHREDRYSRPGARYSCLINLVAVLVWQRRL